jgi:HTH-type transcriptional regulator / antitoxin HigA
MSCHENPSPKSQVTMKPHKLLKTAEEHAAALDRLDELMRRDPQPGSTDEDELELLGLLIDTYEKQHFPVAAPSATEAIRFRMEQMGLKQKDLAPLLGGKSRVSEVLSGKRPLTLAMARAVHTKLKIPADILLGRDEAELPDAIDPASYPVKDMHKLGWFERWKGLDWQAVKGEAEEMLQEFFSLFSGPRHFAFNRAGFREGETPNADALDAWRCRVLTRAAERSLPAFERESITPAMLSELAQLSRFEDGPKRAKDLLESLGIPVVIEEHLSKTYLDGAALLGVEERPVIGLTLRHDRLDNFWFTLFHEVGHVLLHLGEDQRWFFDNTESGDHSRQEEEANKFALDHLIPEWEWRHIQHLKLAKEIRAEAERLKINPAIIAGRLRRQANDYKIHGKLVGQGEVSAILGFAKVLN